MGAVNRQPTASAAFQLAPPPPFRLDLAVWTLRRQAHNHVDRWDGTTYRRTLALSEGAVEMQVHQTAPADAPRLAVELGGAGTDERATRSECERQLRRLLGLDACLDGFYRLAAADPELGPLAYRFRGMRPPRYTSLFETLANAIACQQVSLTVGILLLNRLAEHFGLASHEGFAFPSPMDLLERATPDALRDLGFSYTKARTLLGVAEACSSGALSEDNLANLDDAEAVGRLTALRGIGRWSAEYALLRGFGRLHVFPGDDVGAQRYLAQWLNMARHPDYNDAHAALQRWRDYAGLIYLHLLLQRLHPAA